MDANNLWSVKDGIEMSQIATALDFPHVWMRVPARQLVDEADRLASDLLEIGVSLLPIGSDYSQPCIQASYDPCDQQWGIIGLMGLEDEDWCEDDVQANGR